MADTLAAKSPSGPAPLAPSPEASLAALPVDLADLPADVRERLRARAQARAGRLAIGRYVIVGELGRGGMGVVYDAWDPRIDRRVAIKTIEPDLVPDEGEREEVIERFLREIKVVGKLQHPSIVTIFDYGEDPELRRGDDPYASGRIYFYVMEYLEGRSLAKILREKKQMVDLDAVQIGLDVAEALRVAHARGIIHRDIKPSNILIRGDQRAVLLDFGIAKTGQPALTRQGQILGTPTYLAPERLREKEDGLDGRADIFSLGVLLYTMLVGEAPFQGDNVYDLLDNIAKQTHTKLARSTQGGVVLSRAIDRMLAKRPQDRYSTADEVVQALKSAQALLEKGTPDVSDLGAGLVLVSEPMGDAATEIATPSEPIATPAMMPALAKPGDTLGTSPEVQLHRSTRRIDVHDVGAQTSPEVWDPEGSLRELDDADLQPISEADGEEGTDSGDTAGATMPGNRHPQDNGGGVTLKASASMQLEAVRAPGPPRQTPSPPIPAISTHELRAPIRRVASLAGEEETLAEPLHTDSDLKTASEIRLDALDLSPPPREGPRDVPARGATTASRGRRPRIEASLVDEEDVVVRPAPLDALRPDEVPTQAGVPSPAHNTSPSYGTPVAGTPVAGSAARPGDPLETDIVRPRRIAPRDPAEQARAQRETGGGAQRETGGGAQRETGGGGAQRDAAGAREAARRAADLELQERPTNSVPPPPASAAVARRTIAARGASGRRAPALDARADDIRVTGTDLDRPGARSRARLRLFLLLALAALSIGVGLYLGRRKEVPIALPTPAVAPAPSLEPRAFAAEPSALTAAPVAPRRVEEIVADAEAVLAKSQFAEADRLFARALESAPEGGALQARALVGRAKALSGQGETDRADRLLRRVIELRGDSAEAREARQILGLPASAPVAAARPTPSAVPRVSAPPMASASPSAASAAPRPSATARAEPASRPSEEPAPTPARTKEAPITDLSIEDQCKALVGRYLADAGAGVAAFEAMASRVPTAACAHKQLGTFYRKVGNDRAALAAYRRYLELEPGAPDRSSIESRIQGLASKLGP